MFGLQQAARAGYSRLSARAFGAAVLRPAVEGGRIKVTDHLIWLNVVCLDGVPRRISATKGESLLEVLTRSKVPGIFPDCGGGD